MLYYAAIPRQFKVDSAGSGKSICPGAWPARAHAPKLERSQTMRR